MRFSTIPRREISMISMELKEFKMEEEEDQVDSKISFHFSVVVELKETQDLKRLNQS